MLYTTELESALPLPELAQFYTASSTCLTTVISASLRCESLLFSVTWMTSGKSTAGITDPYKRTTRETSLLVFYRETVVKANAHEIDSSPAGRIHFAFAADTSAVGTKERASARTSCQIPNFDDRGLMLAGARVTLAWALMCRTDGCSVGKA